MAIEREDVYRDVKKKLVGLRIPTQNILGRTIRSPRFNVIVPKLLIQINAKLSGQPWEVQLPVVSTSCCPFLSSEIVAVEL
jgi:hypothetical protein